MHQNIQARQTGLLDGAQNHSAEVFMTTISIQDTFNVDSLIEEAQRKAGSSGESEVPAFIAALKVLAHSLDTEARLTPRGRIAVRNGLVTALRTQLEVQRSNIRHPEIQDIPIARPVFVIGLMRTGSTLVHNLLSQHPDLRVPNLWELLFPTGGEGGPRAQEALASYAQTYVDEYNRVAPQLKSIHFLDARRPDECHRLGGNTFQSMVYEMRYRVPSYSNWLRTQDFTPVYQYHQLQLKHILWRIGGEVVVLKCPFHLWNIEELARVYPTARFIHLHREPTSVLLSTCSLCTTLRGARSDIVDQAEIGQQWLAHNERGMAKIQKALQGSLADKPVLDVFYHELLGDTLGVMKQICDFIDVPLTKQAEGQMYSYLYNNQQNKHGSHKYTARDFGLNPRDLEERFADYRNRYELAPTGSNR